MLRMIWLGLAVSALLLSSLFAAERAPDFPLYEDHVAKGIEGLREYVQKAEKYMKDNPASIYNPRLALDCYVLAASIKDAPMIEQLRTLLLFQLTDTLQARYVASTFTSPAAYRDFVLDVTERGMDARWPVLPTVFSKVVRLGTDYFRDTLLSDGLFALYVHTIATEAGDKDLAAFADQRMKMLPPGEAPPAKLLEICSKEGLKPSERVKLLYALDEKGAAFLAQFFSTRMSAEELQNPEMVPLLLDAAMKRLDYRGAIELIRSLPEEKQADPKMLFWQGRCLFGLEQDGKAMEVLDALAAKDKAPWAPHGKAFAGRIRTFDAGKAAAIDAAVAFIETLTKGVNSLELQGKYVSSDRKNPGTTSFYIGSLPKQGVVEFSISRDGKMLVAYKTTAATCEYYIAGDPGIVRIRQAGPVPLMSLARNANDHRRRYSFRVAFAPPGTMRLVDLPPWLLARQGLEELITYTSRIKGWCIEPPKDEKDQKVYALTSAETEEAVSASLKFTVAENGAITGVTCGGLSITMQYAADESVKLSPPKWPTAPVAEKDTMDMDALMRLYMQMLRQVKGDDESPTVTEYLMPR